MRTLPTLGVGKLIDLCALLYRRHNIAESAYKVVPEAEVSVGSVLPTCRCLIVWLVKRRGMIGYERSWV